MGMADLDRGAGDSNLLLYRPTTAVTLSMAACAPTTQRPCTVCVLCKPGEPPDGGWGTGVGPGAGSLTVGLTCPCPQPPVCLRPAVLLHQGRHAAPHIRLDQRQYPGPWP